MFTISVKRYLKTPVLGSLTVLWLVYYIYGLFHREYNDFLLDGSANILDKVEVSFLFFMFVSYVYQSKSKQAHFDETISGIPSGMLRQIFSQHVFLLLFAAMVSAGTFLYMYSQMEKFQVSDHTLVVFLVKLVIIHQFLPHLLAILLGLAISGMKSKTAAYCVLVIFYMLLQVKNIATLEEIFMGKADWLKRIPRFLNLYSQGYSGMNNYYYIFSVENVNLQRIGAWLGIAVSVILLQKLPHGKKHFSSIPFILGVVCFGIYLQPAGELYLGDGDDDFWIGDQQYYMYADEDAVRDKDADFKLTRMQADFTIDRLLDADVTLHVDKADLNLYCFTLYHGYRMKEVKDQNGEKLEFRQEGDYLTVQSSGKEVSALTFSYSGFNGHCYTTSQGIFLPGYLEYYPVPGSHPVYIRTVGYDGYTMDGPGYDMDYQITVHTRQKVYSNLPSDGKNCFKGRCDAVSLYAGEFMRETTVGDCKILYSPLSPRQSEAEGSPEEYLEFIRWYEAQSGEKLQLLCLPAGGNPEYYFGDGQLMGDISTLKDYYERYQMTGDWYQTLSEEELEYVEQLKQEIKQLEEESKE